MHLSQKQSAVMSKTRNTESIANSRRAGGGGRRNVAKVMILIMDSCKYNMSVAARYIFLPFFLKLAIVGQYLLCGCFVRFGEVKCEGGADGESCHSCMVWPC